MTRPAVAEREREIVKFLQSSIEGAPAKEIHGAVAEVLGEDVSLQAYYKVLDRMVAAGTLQVVGDDGERGRIYRVTPRLYPENALTLDDIYEMLPYLQTSDAIAKAIDAQDYFEEQRGTVLAKAAAALLEEDAVEVFHGLIVDKLRLLKSDLEVLRTQELADAGARHRVAAGYAEIEHIAFRGLSLPPSALRVPPLTELEAGGTDLAWDEEAIRKALRRRVFGDTFLRVVDVSASRGSPTRSRMTVSGSDGSMHAGSLQLQTARGFVEDYQQIITFNNSVAYSPRSRAQREAIRRKDLVHSAPLTRETIDDPAYRGMVLAPFMYPDLSESEYEHMARCATDVVQLRVDAAVIGGTARDLISAELWPKPTVHIRDGTVTPQERWFSHYNRPDGDGYGEMVREGIRLQRMILDRIASSPKAPIFAGAVKATQFRLFSKALNWYISRGSARQFGQPIEPNWNMSRAAGISDNVAMTNLLAALKPRKEGAYYVTCAVLRQFHSLTELYKHDTTQKGWREFFEEKRAQDLEAYKKYGGALSYHAGADIEDDDYIRLCERADYVSFYIGHTGGDIAPIVPRYEFLDSLRDWTENGDDDRLRRAAERIAQAVERVVEALDETSFAQDRDHNFLSLKTIIRLIPRVVQQAHEFGKTLGRKLENELRSAVVKRLIEAKRLRVEGAGAVKIAPVGVRQYVERYARALTAETPKDEGAPPR